MKYIQKEKAPLSLRTYRETTPNASYNGFSDKKVIREALLKEQGHICAYCMRRISLDLNNYHKPKIEIEHYLSQDNFPNKTLNYQNMLGVCNGNLSGISHCDKSKDNKSLKTLNPLKFKTSEQLINYKLNGEIVSKSNNSDVEEDINIILNLNNEQLIQYRKDALDKAKKDFIKRNPKKQWIKKCLIMKLKNINQRKKRNINHFVNMLFGILNI